MVFLLREPEYEWNTGGVYLQNVTAMFDINVVLVTFVIQIQIILNFFIGFKGICCHTILFLKFSYIIVRRDFYTITYYSMNTLGTYSYIQYKSINCEYFSLDDNVV